MANIYDQPAQAQFINTYAPIPFQEIVQAGQARQQRYDINKAAFDTMAEQAESLKGIPSSEDETYISGTVLPTIRELSDVYAGRDYGDPEVIRDIHNKLKSKINKRLVSDIQTSYQNWMSNQQNIAKLKATGHYQPYLEIPYSGYSTEQRGIYTDITPASLDYRKNAQEYFRDIRDSVLTSPDTSGKYYIGVGDTKIQAVAKEGTQSFLESPQGRQKIQEYRYRTGDYTTPESDIAYNYLLDVGEEYKRANIHFVPGYAMETQEEKIPSNLNLVHTLRTQPTDVTGVSWKELNSNVKDYETQRETLESNVRIAESNGQFNLAESYKGQLANLDDKYSSKKYWTDKIKEDVTKQFKSSLDRSVESFSNTLSTFIKDTNAVVKWRTAFANTIINENIPSVNKVAAVNAEYIKLYGQDSDYTKYESARGYRMGKLANTINDHLNDVKDVLNKRDKYASQEWNSLRSDGIIQKTAVLPIVETSVDFKNFPEWRLLNNLLKTTPQDFNIQPVTSRRKEDSNKLIEMFTNPSKQDYNLKSIDLISAGTDDIDGPFIYVQGNFAKLGKKGKEDQAESHSYKIRLQDQSQTDAIARTFMKQGNVYEGLKFINPTISQNIEKAFKNNQQPDTLIQTILGNNVVFKLFPDGAYYLVDNSNNMIDQKPYYNKEDIKARLYTIFGINTGYIQLQ